jgi:DNA-binding transcriptional LysR family regulator
METRKLLQRSSSFELRHLRYFTALVEEKNFAKAAARLGIAQPGLSQQIINLEAILDVSLLDRSRRSVKLTVSGELLYNEARAILEQVDSTLAALVRVGRGEAGRISIGYVASAAYSGALTDSIASFRKIHVDVELQLLETEMRQQLAAIAEGTLDFGYIRPPAPIPPGIATQLILHEPLVVALQVDHALAYRESIDPVLLAGSTFITPRQPPDVGFHANTLDACTAAGFNPQINAIGRDFTTIASMVAVGLGIAIGPRSLSCLQLPGVRYIPLTSTVTSDLSIAYRKTEASPAVRAFIAHHRTRAP